ncbi:Transcription elongation factor 1 [Perkinsus olseni]|uniref:Transcription elongation factor 1 homolog n=1 Tax=Perkinsus olseni TaxID=32597 RepID=A0A7J6UPP9_PEROL|nr:Transcription elongation factor 1 [Perkinsus olseni]
MGRRKGKAMKAARPKPKLDTTFDCPFCNSEKSIEVKMDRQKKIGTLRCRMCHVDYQMRIQCNKEALGGPIGSDSCRGTPALFNKSANAVVGKFATGEVEYVLRDWQSIEHLHEPVDVYAHWVDQCEELNQRERDERSSKRRRLDEDSLSESESGESDY